MQIYSINIKACADLNDVIVFDRDKTHALIQVKAGGTVAVIELNKLIRKRIYKMSDDTCDKCHYVDQLPTGECSCTQDLKEVNADDKFACFLSRAEMFDNENVINFDD